MFAAADRCQTGEKGYSEEFLRISSVTVSKIRTYPVTFHKDCTRKRRSLKIRAIPMNTRIVVAIAVVIGLAIIGALVYAGMGRGEKEQKDENKQKVAMTELPAAVQKTIQDNVGGGTITQTAKETEGGRTYYDAEVQKSGGEKVEIKVAEDGSLIGVGKEKEEEDDD